VRAKQGLFVIERPCPTCSGRGTVIENPCRVCHGEGRLDKAQTLKVDIKLKAGDAIDLFVVKADAVGEIVGNSPNEKKKWEAGALGFKRDQKSGSFTVKVPANTKYKVIVMQCDTAKVKSEFDLNVTN
jgi:RecJ-like exonuclease